jgi:hypothetical protein
MGMKLNLAIEEPTEAVAGSFYKWLQTEVETSGTDRNRYLDEYDRALEGLKAGWEDPRNFTARKLESHNQRLPLWWEAYTYNPLDDYQSARILFAGLMQLSGAYRDQCYVQARDADDYIERRQKAIGIDLKPPVGIRMYTYLPSTGNLARARISNEDLKNRMEKSINVGEVTVKNLCRRAEIGEDLGKAHSPAVVEMYLAQENWTTFCTDCVILAAKLRKGKLSSVPFLEPKSISEDPQVYYPLAG